MLFLLLFVLADDPTFHLRSLRGKELSGPLASLDASWNLELGAKVRRKIAARDWLWLQRHRAMLPELPRGEHLILTDGARIPFLEARLKGDDLFFRHPDLGKEPVAVPLSAVLMVWRTGLEGDPLAERTRRLWMTQRPSRDQLRLRNGDLIEGTLESLGDSVSVERERKTLSAAWSTLSAIVLSAEAGHLAPKKPLVRAIILPNNRSPGGRFTLVSARLDGGDLVGKTPFGATLRVGLERLARLERLPSAEWTAAVPLYEVAGRRYRYRPYLDEQIPLGVDATPRGRDLRVGGQTWERGLSLAVGAEVTIPLAGKYQRFEAVVGLDDLEGAGGRAKVVIRLDDKPLSVGPRDTLGDPFRLDCDLNGAQTLSLRVEAAGRGPVRGIVNWVDAWLVR
ncbi:MAG: NPCBM/NEW2 domain-containing protein [Gemmataceae bacterium]